MFCMREELIQIKKETTSQWNKEVVLCKGNRPNQNRKNKWTWELKLNIAQKYLANIYRIFHPTVLEYILSTSAWTFLYNRLCIRSSDKP